MIMSPDSTFYKLHSDIYFAKVLSQAMLVRTIFRKTLLKVYSTLKNISRIIIQQIVTLSKYGHDALDICHP